MSRYCSFVKHLSRGWNSCARCDVTFKVHPDSSWAKHKADKSRRLSSASQSSSHAKHEIRRDESRRESEKSAEQRPPSRPQVGRRVWRFMTDVMYVYDVIYVVHVPALERFLY